MSQIVDKLVWIDLEATGLILKKDKIIQIAILVTDTQLNLLDEKGYVGFIHIEDEDIALMDDIVKEMHTKNGLIELCKKSSFTLEDVDKGAVDYVSKFVNKNEAPLCGNTIAFDRSFINYSMPLLADYLHYRNIDVSTIKQLNQIWGNDVYKKREGTHEAMDDIRESIEELKYYKSKIFEIRLNNGLSHLEQA
jgi:oligoribonuclease